MRAPKSRFERIGRRALLCSRPQGDGKRAFEDPIPNAEEATSAEAADDIAYLRCAWPPIRERSHSQPPGTLLHQDLSLAERPLRDLTNDVTQAVRIDSASQFEVLRRFGETFMPCSVGKLELYRSERAVFDLFSIEGKFVRVLARRVDLKRGGYLIIDQTEAFTTIDVNTTGYVGSRKFEDTISCRGQCHRRRDAARRGEPASGGAERLHRQADFPQRRADDQPGAVRRRVAVRPRGAWHRATGAPVAQPHTCP